VDTSLTTKEFCLFRLYETFFLQEFQPAFYKRNDTHVWTQLDASKSEKLPPTYWELVSRKYNNPGWVPNSSRFNGWGGTLTESYSLPLIEGKTMNEETARTAYNTARASMLTVSSYKQKIQILFIFWYWYT